VEVIIGETVKAMNGVCVVDPSGLDLKVGSLDVNLDKPTPEQEESRITIPRLVEQ
jgi:hypothetical protein